MGNYYKEQFYKDLERGKKGEAAVKKIMEERGAVVIDVTNDDEYREKEIDFLINGKGCEVKTDFVMHKTHNILLEDFTVNGFANYKNGWFSTTEADFLFYLDWENQILYIYSFDDLRAHIAENYVRQIWKDDEYKQIVSYCLDVDAVRHQTIML